MLRRPGSRLPDLGERGTPTFVIRTMAAVGLNRPGRGRSPGAPNPRTSTPGTKAMVLGSIIQTTMSSAPVTRNTGRQWVHAIHTSHRIGLRRAVPGDLGALYRSAGPTDELLTTSIGRRGHILIAASDPAGLRRLLLSVCLTLRFFGA